jgi:bifunctional non-homologous end joining protein LigD
VNIRAGRHTIAISSPDKVLFPDDGITKADLARYYDEIAPAMLPHVRERPVSMLSYPGGIAGRGHFTKEVPRHFPDWIARVTVPKKDGEVTHLLANDAATLVYLAGQNCITPHVWPARADRPDEPDRLIVDLDPTTDRSFADIRATARELGDAYRDAGLAPFAQVTGSRGIHVVAPLRRGPGFHDVREAALAIAQKLVDEHPDRLTLEFHKEKRGDRIFVDVNRNGYAQTAVPPYAVRPRPGAPVAMPLHWEELSDAKLRPDKWTVTTAAKRVESDGDPWKGIARHARSLPSP